MSEGGGLVEEVGVPQQGDDDEIEESEDKERHDVRDSEEGGGRHDDRQRRQSKWNASNVDNGVISQVDSLRTVRSIRWGIYT